MLRGVWVVYHLWRTPLSLREIGDCWATWCVMCIVQWCGSVSELICQLRILHLTLTLYKLYNWEIKYFNTFNNTVIWKHIQAHIQTKRHVWFNVLNFLKGLTLKVHEIPTDHKGRRGWLLNANLSPEKRPSSGLNYVFYYSIFLDFCPVFNFLTKKGNNFR